MRSADVLVILAPPEFLDWPLPFRACARIGHELPSEIGRFWAKLKMTTNDIETERSSRAIALWW
jgi:hypothetical protein